jgi:hypothetical protein
MNTNERMLKLKKKGPCFSNTPGEAKHEEQKKSKRRKKM